MPEAKAENEKIGRNCPQCGSDLVIRWGRFGKFISCSNFPECRFTEPWLEKIGIECPECKQGEVVRRKSRKGRVFYGCSRYPECAFTSWKEPIKIPCPKCQGTLVITNKNKTQCLQCQEDFYWMIWVCFIGSDNYCIPDKYWLCHAHLIVEMYSPQHSCTILIFVLKL